MQTESMTALQEWLSDLQSQLDELYDAAPFGSYSTDAEGRLNSINHRALHWLGRTRSELLGRKPEAELFAPGSQPLLRSRMSQQGSGAMSNLELELLTRTGKTVDVSTRVVSGLAETGSSRSRRVLMFDNRTRREEQIGRRMAALSFDSPNGCCIMDASGSVVLANPGFAQLCGYAVPELVGRELQVLSANRQSDAVYLGMWHALVHKGSWQGEIQLRRKDLQAFTAWVEASAISDESGAAKHFVARMYDITAYKTARQDIDRLAFFDPLTQLPNRRLLLNQLEAELTACRLEGKHGALLFIDIDNFKTINDTRGHAAGDQLLVEVARRLRLAVRSEDITARLGGDEFVCLLTAIGREAGTAATNALKAGHKILEALKDSYRFSNFTFSTSASIGVCVIDGSENVSEVLLQADLAMYEAKRAGRNAVRQFHPAMRKAADEHAELKQELWRALRQQEFELHYQPQFDEHWRVTGAEALLRWNHPTKGLVAPGVFLEAAEQTGLMVPMGRWVIEEACRQLAAWSHRQDALRSLVLSVNVSAMQFGEADFVAHLQQALQQHGVNPARLMLELTETTVHSVEDIRSKMLALGECGIRFALDDFGIGHSSLVRLISLPINQLKIDRSFVHDMASSGAANVVVNTIIAMSDSLGLEVIAEGVETREQQNALHAAGCTLFQGYLMSRPVAAAPFSALLAAGSAHRPLNTSR